MDCASIFRKELASHMLFIDKFSSEKNSFDVIGSGRGSKHCVIFSDKTYAGLQRDFCAINPKI